MIETEHNQPEVAPDKQLDAILANFKRDPLLVNVSASSYGVQNNAPQDPLPAEETDEGNAVPAEDQSQEEETEESETEVEEPTEFGTQFKETFGIEPAEAVELVNSLTAFRDEQTLMRQWQTTPSDYDSRMKAVREFYNTLPEDGRDQFNNVQGAAAIWEHLQTLAPKATADATSPTTAKGRSSKSKTKQTKKPAFDFTKTQILTMPKDEYHRKLPAISRAYQTGRVDESK